MPPTRTLTTRDRTIVAKKQGAVPRPIKHGEWTICHASRNAQQGWSDLLATQKSALTDAWDFLTKHPGEDGPKNGPLRGNLGKVTNAGVTHGRRQYECHNGARIWCWLEDHTVWLEQVHTNHPNQTT